MVHAPVHDRIAGAHRNRAISLIAEIRINVGQGLVEVPLLHAERPGNVVAKL